MNAEKISQIMAATLDNLGDSHGFKYRGIQVDGMNFVRIKDGKSVEFTGPHTDSFHVVDKIKDMLRILTNP